MRERHEEKERGTLIGQGKGRVRKLEKEGEREEERGGLEREAIGRE